MNLLLAVTIFCGMDLYFLKDSPNLLVRAKPETSTVQIDLHYSFQGETWDSMIVGKRGEYFDTVITTPEELKLVGFYFVQDNGKIDDNGGALYLYEVRTSPKMIMPISLVDLEKMLSQAENKITSGKNIDEAITLIDYVNSVLAIVPITKNSPNELQRNMLQDKVGDLRQQLTK